MPPWPPPGYAGVHTIEILLCRVARLACMLSLSLANIVEIGLARESFLAKYDLSIKILAQVCQVVLKCCVNLWCAWNTGLPRSRVERELNATILLSPNFESRDRLRSGYTKAVSQ